jgi:ATP phosphoribosyltransferase regulatory subunit
VVAVVFSYPTVLLAGHPHPPRPAPRGAAAGRYDGLLTRLGAAAPIPAVGFAVWIERLGVYGGAR